MKAFPPSKPAKITLNYHPAEKRFRLSFGFRAPMRLPAVVYEFSEDGGMMLMRALQRLQARHKIPIPSSLRPKGRPKLSVVLDDD